MKQKFSSELCNNKMTFQDCELAILRHAVDEAEKTNSSKLANSESVKRMIDILEGFLIKTKSICYGGTAINNILPKDAQFYDRDIEIPDYDFFSPNAMEHAKALADLYAKEGFEEVEAKAGVHFGTYKVFVDFIPIADITFLHPTIFKALSRDSISIAGIKYCPPNYLRMNMFLELSRPMGDVSRWEKVLKRLTLLNTYYPLKTKNCNLIDFQRPMDSFEDKAEILYFSIRDTLSYNNVIFLGGFATRLYSKYEKQKNDYVNVKKIPDFDVIVDRPERVGTIIIEQLKALGFDKLKLIEHDAIGEIIPHAYEVRLQNETLVFLYEPIACHSYNIININNYKLRIATIDTMLTFYLAFYYSDLPYHDKERILCMCKFLFDIETKNRLEQKGLLKRFSIDCEGTQATLESIRAEKVRKFEELRSKRGTKEYDMWFLKYSVGAKKNKKVVKNKTRGKPKRKRTVKKQSSLITKIREIL
tara:strand:- start:585 stop:2009 length:1425 start_codon:yes stop_codon:yes gene_type:complete